MAAEADRMAALRWVDTLPGPVDALRRLLLDMSDEVCREYAWGAIEYVIAAHPAYVGNPTHEDKARALVTAMALPGFTYDRLYADRHAEPGNIQPV